MNKLTFLALLFVIVLIGIYPASIKADWWERPAARPTQPSLDRHLPTSAPEPSPTDEPEMPLSEPTITPDPGKSVITPGIGGVEDSKVSNSDEEDPCGEGKAYTGPYCGWSPDHDTYEASENIASEPQVLGLSDTSSRNLPLSDIMQLVGVLCLLLYARSKLLPKKSL